MYGRDCRVPASGESCLFQHVSAEDKSHVIDLRAIPLLSSSIENALLHFIIETTSGLREEYALKGNCARSKCREGPTHVERSVEAPDTLRRDRSFTNHSSFAFNQLRHCQQEPNFGRRSAPFPETKGDPLFEGLRKKLDESGRISETRDE